MGMFPNSVEEGDERLVMDFAPDARVAVSAGYGALPPNRFFKGERYSVRPGRSVTRRVASGVNQSKVTPHSQKNTTGTDDTAPASAGSPVTITWAKSRGRKTTSSGITVEVLGSDEKFTLNWKDVRPKLQTYAPGTMFRLSRNGRTKHDKPVTQRIQVANNGTTLLWVSGKRIIPATWCRPAFKERGLPKSNGRIIPLRHD